MYKNVFKLPKEIIDDLSDYEASDTSNRKCPRYALSIDDESGIGSLY